ncbi:hypothetical protein XENORESO_016798 [Xenotaenia resolanae]|uniref:Uncharacterized protein n=1 Tax=Xenotaenia resolanae TaxID=208358 RepID=A0ABV0W381_9TELE
MKTQASQSYLWLARERQSILSEELLPEQSLLSKKGKINTHVTASWVWLHTVSQIQVLLIKTGSCPDTNTAHMSTSGTLGHEDWLEFEQPSSHNSPACTQVPAQSA